MEHITIKAQEGKVFRRIADGMVFGNEMVLGYTHYLNGKKLDTPLWELPEHFEEIDAPIELEPGAEYERALMNEQINME